MKTQLIVILLILSSFYGTKAQVIIRQFPNTIENFSSETNGQEAFLATGTAFFDVDDNVTFDSWHADAADLHPEITLSFGNAMYVDSIFIFEKGNGGAIDSIWLYNPSNNTWNIVYTGIAQDLGNMSNLMSIGITRTTFKANLVKISINATVNSNYFLDGVALVDKGIACGINPIVNLGNDTTICAGTYYQSALNPVTGIDYYWISNNNVYSTFLNALLLPGAGVNPPIEYVLVANDIAGCSGTDNIVIGAFHTPLTTENFYDNYFNEFYQCPANANDTVVNINAGANFFGNLTYSWSTGETTYNISINNPAVNDVFTVTVTDSVGCERVIDKTYMGTLVKPIVDLGPDTSFCPGTGIELIDLNFNYGNFYWSNNTYDLSYFYEGTGAGDTATIWLEVNVGGTSSCADRDTIKIFNPVFDNTDRITAIDGNSCNGTSDQIDLNLIPGYNYTWNYYDVNGDTLTTVINLSTQHINVDSSGVYAFITSNANCSSEQILTFNFKDPINIDLGNDVIICQGNSITLTPSYSEILSNPTYTWLDAYYMGNVLSNDVTYDAGTQGIYYLMVNDPDYCLSYDSVYVTVDLCTAIAQENNSKISLFPNPATGKVMVTNIESGMLYISDMLGRVIVSRNITGFNYEIDLSNLNNGAYNFKVVSGSEIYFEKIILNK